jgi:hypothetical protein
MENVVDNNFDLLKKLDNDELYNKTYITIDNLEAIKNKDFQAFSRFKLMGFIDILSKRLELDLSELKKEANQYFDSIEPIIEIKEPDKNSVVFDNGNKKILFAIGGSIIIGILIGVALYFVLSSDTKKDLTDIQVSPPSSVVVTPPILELPQEQNTTVDTNMTNESDKNLSIEVAKVEKLLQQDDGAIKIVPTRKIWIGIINLDTKEKKEHVTSDELAIDKSINQIIVINGAYLSLMVGNEEKRYDFDGRVRFICKDGKIKEIKFAEFKALNDGKAWN